MFSRPALHPQTKLSSEQKAIVKQSLESRSRARQARMLFEAVLGDSIFLPISTVSVQTSFDAYIDVGLAGAPPGRVDSLVVDSGNSVLILPRWERIEELPNWEHAYTVLGEGPEPWGCPAKIVRGPIHLTTIGGDSFVVPDAVFYACTGAAAEGEERTANFGAARLSPWSSSPWNTPPNTGITMQAPLSYAVEYPFVEFNYAPAPAVLSAGPEPRVASGSYLGLHKTIPSGYALFDVIPNKMWMALEAKALSIGGVRTPWPGTLRTPIAVIDTGGTCAFLSDPNQYVCGQAWPDPVENPEWTSTSTHCESVRDAIAIELGDGRGSYSYTVDTSAMPATVQGLTLVMCETNAYMRGENGMNIGGISALGNSILVDYANARVGFRPR